MARNGEVADTASRIRWAAAEFFIERGFEAVSIAEIAAAAHCSTATIYEMFQTKEALYLDAVSHFQLRFEPPRMRTADRDGDALGLILEYCVQRIEFLEAARTRGVMLASLLRSRRPTALLTRLFRERDQVTELGRTVERAIRAGDVRDDADVDGVAYCIMTGVSFEPLIMNLHNFGPVPPIPLLRTVLSPFLTPGGARKMTAWIASRALADDPAQTWRYLEAIDSASTGRAG